MGNTMKTIQSTLSLSIVTMFALFVFSGCYTQLAYIADEPDSIIGSPAPVIYQPQTTIVIYEPVYIPDPPQPPSPGPIYDPLPLPGYSPVATEAPAPTRDSGYRRSDASEERQTTDSGTRSSGDRRSR
jgi:hypothetical protein